MASAFFLRGEGILHRPCAADLFIDVQQIAAQFPETVIPGNFILRFAQGGRRREGFGCGFAIYLAGKAIKARGRDRPSYGNGSADYRSGRQ